MASLRSFPDPAQAPYDDIVADAEEFRSTFEVLTENTHTVKELGALIRQYRVYGKGVHDANLVAAMRVHGLHDLSEHSLVRIVVLGENLVFAGFQHKKPSNKGVIVIL